MAKIVEIDYGKIYGNVIDRGFTASLGLNEIDQEIMRRLFYQCDEGNPYYIPDLQIESMVTEDISPYHVIQVLNNLKRRRVIHYGIAERIPTDQKSVSYDEIILTPVVESAKRSGIYVESKKEDETAVPITNYEYRRVAIFNLEYPVVYFCYKEEEERGEDLSGEDYASVYHAIEDNALGNWLSKITHNATLLEFLNFVQSMFQQPFTEKSDEPNDSSRDSESPPGGGGLVTGIQPAGVGGEIPEALFDNLSLVPETGVEVNGEGKNSTEAEVTGNPQGHTGNPPDQAIRDKIRAAEETPYPEIF